MRIVLTTKEVLARFGLPSDAIIELVEEDFVDEGPDSEGWVSNVGRYICWHPSSLKGDTKIEVRYRNGEKRSGVASFWGTGWQEAAGLCTDIVAYRILS